MTDTHDGRDGDAQAEYDGDPALRKFLTQAAESPTVHRDNAEDVSQRRSTNRAKRLQRHLEKG